jgi:hypothetical protein
MRRNRRIGDLRPPAVKRPYRQHCVGYTQPFDPRERLSHEAALGIVVANRVERRQRQNV